MGRPSRESRLLTVLFFAPPALVALAVLGPWDLHWLPQAETPYGSRFEPPIALPDTPPADARCDPRRMGPRAVVADLRPGSRL